MKSFKFFSNNYDLESKVEVIPDWEYYRRRDNEARMRYYRDRQEERQRQMRALDEFNLENKLRARYEQNKKRRKRRLSKTFKGRVVLFLESLGFNLEKYI